MCISECNDRGSVGCVCFSIRREVEVHYPIDHFRLILYQSLLGQSLLQFYFYILTVFYTHLQNLAQILITSFSRAVVDSFQRNQTIYQEGKKNYPTVWPLVAGNDLTWNPCRKLLKLLTFFKAAYLNLCYLDYNYYHQSIYTKSNS